MDEKARRSFDEKTTRLSVLPTSPKTKTVNDDAKKTRCESSTAASEELLSEWHDRSTASWLRLTDARGRREDLAKIGGASDVMAPLGRKSP